MPKFITNIEAINVIVYNLSIGQLWKPKKTAISVSPNNITPIPIKSIFNNKLWQSFEIGMYKW